MTDFAAKLAAVATQALAADPAAAQRVETAIRREFGGQQFRVSSRPPVTLDAIDQGLFARKSVSTIAGELGVSRSTLYRHLGKRHEKRKSQRAEAVGQP